MDGTVSQAEIKRRRDGGGGTTVRQQGGGVKWMAAACPVPVFRRHRRSGGIDVTAMPLRRHSGHFVCGGDAATTAGPEANGGIVAAVAPRRRRNRQEVSGGEDATAA